MSKRSNALLLPTALLLASASPVLAQSNTADTGDTVEVTTNDTFDVTTNDTVDVVTNDPNDDDDDGGKWGLLGLLGLAGLLGLKRRDDHGRVDRTTDNSSKRL